MYPRVNVQKQDSTAVIFIILSLYMLILKNTYNKYKERIY